MRNHHNKRFGKVNVKGKKVGGENNTGGVE